MTSTVLDGVLCLLLVSAAVVTVTTAEPHEPAEGGRAPAVASTLATTTATVDYRLSVGDGRRVDRRAHGTLAALLARAAVDDATVGRRPLRESDTLQRAVVGAVRGVVRTNHTRVTAVWRPYPGASVQGQVRVGSRPPPDVPVHVATLDVSSGLPPRRDRVSGGRTGVAGVASAVADGIVDGLFPPVRTRTAAGGGDPEAELVRHRYRRTARLLGVNGVESPAEGNVSASNDRLAAALAERVERDLRVRGAPARRAADGVRVGRVRVTVRTWP